MIRKEIFDSAVKDLENITGVVTEVERYAIHDGPGIRTVVFLKGCFLRCRWCCNPETQQPSIELAFFEDKCIGCKRCVEDCPHHAITFTENGLQLDRSICKEKCYGKVETFPCTARCYSHALKAIGEVRTVLSVYEEISRDVSFYENTGGGMTISGGEPMFQPEFVYGLLRYCKENWMETAMETSGSGSLKDYEMILPYLDVLFIDLKSTNAQRYSEWTKFPIDGPLNVIEKLSDKVLQTGTKMYIRVPVIPQFNSFEQDIYEIGCFIKERCKGVEGVELLPYHKLGRGKYKTIGMEYGLAGFEPPQNEKMKQYTDILLNMGIKVYRF